MRHALFIYLLFPMGSLRLYYHCNMLCTAAVVENLNSHSPTERLAYIHALQSPLKIYDTFYALIEAVKLNVRKIQ